MTKHRLFLLAWAGIWLVVLVFAAKAMLDRLPVPADGFVKGSAQAPAASWPDVGGAQAANGSEGDSTQALRTRDRIPWLLGRLAEGRPYLFGSRGSYLVAAAAYAIVLAALLWGSGRVILEDGEL